MLSGPEFCVECDGDLHFTQKIRHCECSLCVVVVVVAVDDQNDRARLTCVSLTHILEKLFSCSVGRTSDLLIHFRFL